jgi:hypothetical protein
LYPILALNGSVGRIADYLVHATILDYFEKGLSKSVLEQNI